MGVFLVDKIEKFAYHTSTLMVGGNPKYESPKARAKVTREETRDDGAVLKEQLGLMVRVKAGLEKIERNAREVAALLPPKAVTEMRFSQGVIELAQDLQQLADEVAELTKDAVTELQELREGRSSSEPPPQPQPSWRTEADTLQDVARQNPRRGGAFLLGDKALPETKH